MRELLLILSEVNYFLLIVFLSKKPWFPQYKHSVDRTKMTLYYLIVETVMKTIKFSALIPLFALSLLASPVVADNDHEALAKHYESLAEEADVRVTGEQKSSRRI